MFVLYQLRSMPPVYLVYHCWTVPKFILLDALALHSKLWTEMACLLACTCKINEKVPFRWFFFIKDLVQQEDFIHPVPFFCHHPFCFLEAKGTDCVGSILVKSESSCVTTFLPCFCWLLHCLSSFLVKSILRWTHLSIPILSQIQPVVPVSMRTCECSFAWQNGSGQYYNTFKAWELGGGQEGISKWIFNFLFES